MRPLGPERRLETWHSGGHRAINDMNKRSSILSSKRGEWCVSLCGSFPESRVELLVRGGRGLQDLIQSEFLIEPRKKVGNPGLDVLVQYVFRVDDLIPNKRGVMSHGTGGNIASPPDGKAAP